MGAGALQEAWNLIIKQLDGILSYLTKHRRSEALGQLVGNGL